MANKSEGTEPIAYVVRGLERIEDRIAALAARVEHHLTHKRKTPSKRVREVHIRTVAALGSRCPVCDEETMFNSDGAFIGEIHHTEAAADARVESTMPVCRACNIRHNTDPIERAIVDAYHAKRRRLIGPPLFPMRHRASHDGATFAPRKR